MSNHLLISFREHLVRNTSKGQNGKGEQVEYITKPCLQQYWTAERIRELLESYDNIPAENAEQIRSDFICVFSILAYISRPQDIGVFTNRDKNDHQLPLDSAPEWGQWMNEFIEEQYRFCPLEIVGTKTVFKRHLHTRRILPVSYEGPLGRQDGGSGESHLQKVRLHSDYRTQDQEDGLLVFKIYQGDEGEALYKTESDMYVHLGESKHITKFYGSVSYDETGKRIVILELAKGGSLLDFFQQTQPPSQPEDLKLLWTRAVELLDGLHVLHNRNDDIYGDNRQSRIHMDIQPANILVFPMLNSSTYDVKLKFADFGLSVRRRVSGDTSNAYVAPKSEGSRMYSAPECYRNHPVQTLVKTPVTPRADVWAVGAVFSDLLTWSISGEPRREHYRVKRKEEIQTLGHLTGSGYDACYHDGNDSRLYSVAEFHAEILEDTRRNDHISEPVSNTILEFMLTSEDERLLPLQIKTHIQKRIHANLHTSPGDGSPMSPSSMQRHNSNPWRRSGTSRSNTILSSTERFDETAPTVPRLLWPADPRPDPRPDPQSSEVDSQSGVEHQPASSDARPQQPPQRNEGLGVNQYPPPFKQSQGLSPYRYHASNGHITTVDMAIQALEAKDSRNSIGRAWDKVQGRLPAIMELGGMQAARSQVHDHGGRDQIMLIDNFSSMEKYRMQTRNTARVISYVTKAADENGMDLYFASDLKHPRKCYSSKEIESCIKKSKTVNGLCNMAQCLTNVLRPVLYYPWKPTSIYVYTDGVWEPGPTNVDDVIGNAITQLITAQKPSSHLMIQFIQFGRDAEGTRRLQHLDDECVKNHNLLGHYDIVDTKHCEDHVPDIIIGSISKFTDSKNHRPSGLV